MSTRPLKEGENMKILFAIKKRIDKFSAETADALEVGDWGLVARHILLTFLIISVMSIIIFLSLFILWKLLSGILGRILLGLFGSPLVVYILYLSYRANTQDTKEFQQQQSSKAHLEVWAEEIYGYMRDAMFLVFRAASEYTSIVMPSTPGAVELPNCISIRDGYAVFNFFARVREPINTEQVRRDLSRTLTQMLRAHELKGIPSDLVQIGSSYYAPLQLLEVVDYGDSITVSVVFTNEKTVEVIKTRRLLKLDLQRKHEPKKPEDLYDDIHL